jgi:predicted short-subunit dehydrogenase-like oxidoreductase (DUF2520 family)
MVPSSGKNSSRTRAVPAVAVIGIGNVGTALASALHGAGVTVSDLVVHHAPTAGQTKLAKEIGAKLIRLNAWQVSEDRVVWICVPDDQLAPLVKKLAVKLPVGSASRSVFLHTSGVRSYRELAMLKSRSVAIGAAHPFRSFPRAERTELAGTYFAVEGDSRAREAATAMVWRMGGIPFALTPGVDKARYHAFGAFASPLLTTLLAAAEELGEQAGIPADVVPKLLASLAGGTFANWQRYGAARGFSGPIPRGDIETIALHLASLTGMPQLDALYRALSLYAAEHLPARQRPALLKLLRGGKKAVSA